MSSLRSSSLELLCGKSPFQLLCSLDLLPFRYRGVEDWTLQRLTGAANSIACWAVVIMGIRACKAKIATRGFEVEEGDISIGVERRNVHEKP